MLFRSVVEGSVMDIRCDICGEMRTWVIGQEALDRLMAQWQKMHEQAPTNYTNEREKGKH